MDTPIIYTRNGKNVGEFDGVTLRKRVKASKHLFRNMDAWGIDSKLLDTVLVPAKAMIEIRDTEAKKTYRISAELARSRGAFHHFTDSFDDHGSQIFVPRSAFEIV